MIDKDSMIIRKKEKYLNAIIESLIEKTIVKKLSRDNKLLIDRVIISP